MTLPDSSSEAHSSRTTPSLSVHGRALLAPLTGYGLAVAAAVLMTVLILLAVALGTDLGEVDVDEDDASGLGVLLGMPFQLAAMGLFGVLHAGGAGGSVSLFGLPLLLTGAYVAGVAWMSMRLERRDPLQGAGERGVVAVVSAVPAAILVELVTWALAMRSDGEAVHAASVGLFLGVAGLTASSAFVGRQVAAGVPRPAWLSWDLQAAVRLWLMTVVAWVVLAAPVLFVVAWAKAGLSVALTLPVWGPTVALWTYALGHLSGITVTGGVEGFSATRTASSWTVLGPWAFLAAALMALVLAVLAMVAWQRARDPITTGSESLGSFATLPLTWAGGALLISSLTVLHGGGSFSDLGGGATVQVAFWAGAVFLVWGAAVEAGSRFLAPAVAPLAPAALLARLAPQRPGAEQHVGADATASSPPLTPEQRHRVLLAAIVAGGAVLVVVVLVAATSWLGSHRFGPQQAAEEYLQAVDSGDLDRVLSLAPAGDEASDALLTENVYTGVEDTLTGFRVTDVERDGDTAQVTVDVDGVQGGEGLTLSLESDGSRFLVLDRWKLADSGLLRTLSVAPPEGVGIAVNGQDVGAEDLAEHDGTFWVLPGTYAVDPYAGNPWVESDPVPTTVSAEPYSSAYAEVPEPAPSSELMSEVQAQLDAWLDECMASTELEPKGCPQSAYSFYDEVRDVSWRLTEEPTLDLTYWDGTFPADLDVAGGKAIVTYEENQTFFPGDRPDWSSEQETGSLFFAARVDVVGDEVEATFSPY